MATARADSTAASGRTPKAAVLRYQSAAGLAVDGVAGPATLGALRHRRVYSTPGDPVRFLRPISATITDGFGWVGGRRHTGLDMPAAYGTRVGAAGRGRVAFAGWNSGGYGNLVVIKHRLGFESWYAHLSSIAVSPGQWVVGGTTIGYVGSTGRSTGPHLHFEVRRFGTPIDPRPRLLTAAAAGRRPAQHVRRLTCRPNADARRTRDADPPVARFGRCPVVVGARRRALLEPDEAGDGGERDDDADEDHDGARAAAAAGRGCGGGSWCGYPMSCAIGIAMLPTKSTTAFASSSIQSASWTASRNSSTPKDPSRRAATLPVESMVKSHGSVGTPNAFSGSRRPFWRSLST